MTHENNLMTVSQFDGNAYRSSQAAEQTLNAAILRAEIARSYEEFLEIFDKFYADDVEVSSEGSPETIRGKPQGWNGGRPRHLRQRTSKKLRS